MMEVQRSAGGGADLLMECDEEEQEVWPGAPEGDEEEEGCDEALEAAVCPMDEEMDLPPVRIVPIPVQPVSSCSAATHHNTLKSPGAALGFKVNGRFVRLLPEGGATELKLRFHPGGSASGFTTVQIHNPAVNTATGTNAADPNPVITSVVEGEAAQKVLTVVNIKSCPSLMGLKTSSSAPAPPSASPVNLSSPVTFISPWTFTITSPWTLMSPLIKSPAPQTTPPAPSTTPPAPLISAPSTTPSAPQTSALSTTPPAPSTTPSAPQTSAPSTTPSAPQTSAPSTTPPAPQTPAPSTTPPAPSTTPSAPLTTPSAPQTSASSTKPSAPQTTTSAPSTTPSAPQTSAPSTIPSASSTAPSAPQTSAPQTTPSAPQTTPSAPPTTSSAPQTTTPAPLTLALMTTPTVPQTAPPASQTTTTVPQTSHQVLLTIPPVLLTTPPVPQTTPPVLLITTPVKQSKPSALQTTHPVLLTKPPAPQTTPPVPQTTPPIPKTTKPPASSSSSSNTGLAAPHKPLHKGHLGPVPPPECLVCRSQYKLITALRGFLCLCSPAIALCLKNLKKKKNFSRRREKKKTSKTSRDPETSIKMFKSRSGPHAPRVVSLTQRTYRPPDDFLSERHFTSPAPAQPPSTTCSPQKDQSDPPPPSAPHGKLVIMLEDFYYGTDHGQSSIQASLLDRRFTGPYRCNHCPKTLRNNIKLMSHMKQHVSTLSLEDGDITDSQCPHCFRHFPSPFKLQCHLEAVHSRYLSTAKCKICELAFRSELALLWHMKNTHKPGEMPYVCQVCNFRSSFYSEVWSHFEQVHADTKNLMCQYCLRVIRSASCYQQHYAKHQKKHVFSCEQCRLHFLYNKERVEHKLNHRTHIKPPQLIGLKPGTKVTVRTYAVVGESDKEDLKKTVSACREVGVPKWRPVRSLGLLLSTISQESVSRPPQLCVECLSTVGDLTSHFPSLVHCSLCRFITCCSTSYANHMINNHASCRRNPPYLTIFQPEPRLYQRLRCVSCTFTTWRGDRMANHMMERPQHRSIILTHNGLGVNGPETQNQEAAFKAQCVTSSRGQGGGAFIPIHLLPSGQTFTQLSVKPLTSPSPLSSPPAMTIKFLGPRPQPEQYPASPLSASQLSVVLSSLCHGLPQACRRFEVSPLEIGSWIGQQESRLLDRKWCWRTEKMAEWVLSQREQQLSVSEAILLQTARRTLGDDSQLMDRYSWTVDFLLRHELRLLPANNDDNNQHHRGRLPRSVRDNSSTFIHSLSTQIQSRHVPPHSVGSMDEFSIFIDLDSFSKQNPSALQLFGSPEDEPVFDVVLSTLSDGTFLPPLLFFRGTLSHVPEGFPDNVLLEARPEGFSNQERLHIWINQVWRPLVASQRNSESVLIMDVYRGHLTDEFKSSLASLSTSAVFIPPGCCCRVQSLDVCVAPVLRDFLQVRWTQLVSEGGLEGLGLDQLALTLACWLSEVSSTLNSETHFLRRSFASVCNLQQMEDRGEAARMIAALTEALVQAPETPEPAPDPEPEPQQELLLAMEEEEQQMEQDPEEQLLIKARPL